MGKAPNQVLGCTKHHQDARPSPHAANAGIPLRHRFLAAPKSPLFPPNYRAKSKGLWEQADIPQGKTLLEAVPGAPSAEPSLGVWWDHPWLCRAWWRGRAVPAPLPETPGEQPGLKSRYLMGHPPTLLTQFLPRPSQCLFYQRPRLLPSPFGDAKLGQARFQCTPALKGPVTDPTEISPSLGDAALNSHSLESVREEKGLF